MRDWAAIIRETVAEVRRRRVFRVAAVYLVMAWLLVQVADATFEPLGLPLWATKLLIVLLALGFVLACVLSWIYDIGAQGLERTASVDPVDPSPGVPANAPANAPAGASPVPEASVAILPFADLSEARDQDYFCDGLAEEILDALTRVRGLRVASRTSSFRFRDGSTDAREIGRLLNVAAIMEGSVRKAGERIRVTAQLVSAGDGYHLWSETFDRRLEDIFAIQEEIARSVVQALRVTLKAPLALDLQRYAPRDMRAYEFYLQGRHSMLVWSRQAQMYRRAIEIEPDYAQAHAGLADVLVELLLWRLVRPEDVLEEARHSSRRALELAPELAEAHVAQAHLLTLDGRHAAAAEAFEQALALNPELYEANYYYARHCFSQGHFARAIELYEAAHQAHPDEFQALALAVQAAESTGNQVRARELAERALQASLRHLELDPQDARARYLTAQLQLRLGQRDAGEQSIQAALQLQPEDFGTLYNAACYYALAGEVTRGLDLLERAIATGQGFRDWIERDGDLRNLQGHPRFRQILDRVPERTPAGLG